MENEKQIIKHLAHTINEELNSNAISNEMGALIDYGEWSQTAPSFDKVIKAFNLNRKILSNYCDIAQQYYDKHDLLMPEVKLEFPHDSREYHNPWYYILQMLHCIFMAGYFIKLET